MTAANRKAAVRCIQSLRHSRVAAVVYFFSVFFTLACDQNRYELKDDRSGRTIRLDKRTGEIVVIAGDRLTRLKSVEEQDTEHAAARLLEEARAWPDIDLPQMGGAKAQLTTAWRNGQLHYRFAITPVTKYLREARQNWPGQKGFVVVFYDDAQFKIVDVDVPLSKFTTTVDPKGQPLQFGLDDSTAVTQDDYRRIKLWNVTWRGFGPT